MDCFTIVRQSYFIKKKKGSDVVLNKPKFMKPSTNKEECTIDISAAEIPFSCIVDGNESVNAWQIVIYDIVTNDVVFDSGKITLKSSFYPVDEKNRNVVFSVDLKEHLGDNTTFKNRSEAYYWTITLWGSSGCTTTSYQEVFYANKTPDIGFFYKYLTDENFSSLSDGAIMISRACTFKATYRQDDGVQLKRYGWKITDADNGQIFVDTITKNQIYGSADNIICNYNGFLNGGNYSVELFIETQNNAKITFPPLYFTVSYSSTFLSNDFKLETLKNEPAIMLDWNEAIVIAGVLKDENDDVVSVDDTTFKANCPVEDQSSIEIPDGYKVVYDYGVNSNLDIDEDSYIAFSTQLQSGDNAILFVAEGYDEDGNTVRRELSYVNGSFNYDVVGDGGIVKSAKYDVVNIPSMYVWYNIFMSPLIKTSDGDYSIEFNVYEGKVVNCIYPSENLYPSESFYPTFGVWDNLKEG